MPLNTLDSVMAEKSLLQYLDLKDELWYECLEASYGALRKSWSGNWFGMPRVLAECLKFLNLQENNLSEAGRCMLVFIRTDVGPWYVGYCYRIHLSTFIWHYISLRY